MGRVITTPRVLGILAVVVFVLFSSGILNVYQTAYQKSVKIELDGGNTRVTSGSKCYPTNGWHDGIKGDDSNDCQPRSSVVVTSGKDLSCPREYVYEGVTYNKVSCMFQDFKQYCSKKSGCKFIESETTAFGAGVVDKNGQTVYDCKGTTDLKTIYSPYGWCGNQKSDSDKGKEAQWKFFITGLDIDTPLLAVVNTEIKSLNETNITDSDKVEILSREDKNRFRYLHAQLQTKNMEVARLINVPIEVVVFKGTGDSTVEAVYGTDYELATGSGDIGCNTDSYGKCDIAIRFITEENFKVSLQVDDKTSNPIEFNMKKATIVPDFDLPRNILSPPTDAKETLKLIGGGILLVGILIVALFVTKKR